MAKRLLLSILVDVLGNYVEGLTVENLKLGVWSGKIELNHLKLKRNALDGLNLPIVISHGTLNHLKIKIPWTSLESKPVKVTIDGVYLQAGPLNLSKLEADEIRKSILLSKRSKLQEAEDFIMLNGEMSNNHKDSKDSQPSSSYFRNLAMKIIDNIEITLSNIHIRYEDNCISIPNRCLSTGMTISSIRLSTTDDQWKDAFIVRGTGAGKDSVSAIIRKLGILEHLSVYWNVNDENPLDDFGSELWLEAMQKMIFSTPTNDTEAVVTLPSSSPLPLLSSLPSTSDLDYILSPPNQLSLKIVHRPKSTSDLPKIDMTIASSNMIVNFDKIQYQQILNVVATFSQLERYKQMSVYRPQARPTKDPKAWWKYAFKLVLGKDLSISNRIDTIIKCKRKRERYIQLIKTVRKMKTKYPGTIPSEDKELAQIEEELPFTSLLVFRKMAAVDMIREKIEESKTKRSIFGSSSSSSSSSSIPAKPITIDTKHIEKVSEITGPTSVSASVSTISKSTTPATSQSSAHSSSSLSSSASSTLSSLFHWGRKKSNSTVSTTSTESPVIKDTKDRKGSSSPMSKSSVSSLSPSKLKRDTSDIDFDDEVEDNLLIDSIQSQLHVDDSITDEFPVRIQLEASTEIHITYAKKPIVDIKMAMRSDVEVKAQRILLIFSLGNIIVEDMYTSKPVEKYLVKPQIPSTDPNIKQFIVVFESLPNLNSSSLSFRAIPIDITFNSECFQKIFEIFLYQPPIIQTARSQPTKSQIVEVMTTYAKEMTSNTSKGKFSLSVDIKSPNLILPRNSKQDSSGYVFLDCGHFSLNGIIGSGGVRLDANIKGINIGMPDSSKQRYEIQSRGLYLVKPFDVSLLIQNYDKSRAELCLEFRISPFIEAEIDVIKLRRLIAIILSLTNTITSSLSIIKNELEDSSNENRGSILMLHRNDQIDFSKVGKWLVEDIESEQKSPTMTTMIVMDTGSNSNIQTPTIAPVEQRKDLFLSIIIDSVVINMSLSGDHRINSFVESVSLGILISPFETTILLDLKALTMYDSLRPEKFKTLVWTPVPSVSDIQTNLFHFTMIFFNSKDSSIYKGYGSEISLEFLRIGLDLDDQAILRLCPFLRELTKPFDDDPTLRSTLNKNNNNSSSNNSNSNDRSSISMLSTRQRSAFSISSYRPSLSALDSMTSVGIPTQSNDFTSLRLDISISNITLNMVQSRKSVGFERLFALNLIGFMMQYEYIEKGDMTMSLQTVDCIDSRHESDGYYYKTIFNRSSVASEYGSTLSELSDTKGDDISDWIKSASNLTESKKDKIFYMTYTEESLSVVAIQIDVQDVTSFISPDSLLMFINTLMANIDALISMIKAITSNSSSKSSRNKLSTGQSSKQSVKKSVKLSNTASMKASNRPTENLVDNLGYTLKLTVRVINPRLLVLENPRDQNTQAIVSKCGIVLHYTMDVSNGISRESLHVSIHNAEIFILQGLSVGYPQQIVDPTGVEFHMKRVLEKSFVLSAQFSLNMDNINAKVSFHDMLLTNSIIGRTIAIASSMDISMPSQSKNKNENNNENDNDNKNEMKKDNIIEQTQSFDSIESMDGTTATTSMTTNKVATVYNIIFNARSIGITLINDYGTQNLPVLRILLQESQGQVSGPIELLTGDSSFTLSADYYNTRVTSYEPIIEPWCPVISLSSDIHGILVEVINENTLQFNISGALCRSLNDCSNLFTTAMAEYRRQHLKGDVTNPMILARNSSNQRLSTIAPTLPHEISTRFLSTNGEQSIRTEDIPVVFINSLGVPVNIVEHRTKTIIASLLEKGPTSRKAVDRATLQNIYHTKKVSTSSQLRSRDTTSRLPNLYDVHILGELENTYQPLHQLPLNVNVARHYYLQYKSLSPKTSPTSLGQTNLSTTGGTIHGSNSLTVTSTIKSSSNTIPQPKGPKINSSFQNEEVVEEIFQNSRYDVVNRKWSVPWHKYGDPDEWTDGKNRSSVSPAEKLLPTDQWEWIEPEWRVDMTGVVGKEIDENGYEYNINFGNFSVKKKRTFQPLDSVRRRRWIRSRRMKRNIVSSDFTSPKNNIYSNSLWTSSNQSSSQTAVLTSANLSTSTNLSNEQVTGQTSTPSLGQSIGNSIEQSFNQSFGQSFGQSIGSVVNQSIGTVVNSANTVVTSANTIIGSANSLVPSTIGTILTVTNNNLSSNNITTDQSTLLAVFWDVQLQPDGSRKVIIRSGVGITNSMQFSIDIRLGGFVDNQKSVEYGPIVAGETFYVPLKRIHAKSIEIRPSTVNNIVFDWSTALDCRIRNATEKKSAYDNLHLFFIDCNLLQTNTNNSSNNSNTSGNSNINSDYSTNSYSTHTGIRNRVFMRIIIDFSSDKGVGIECLPYAILYNRLPSSFAFKCLCDGSKEHGIITPAGLYHVIHSNPTLSPTLSMQLGSYIWSNARPFEQGTYPVDLVSPFKATEGINLTMNVFTNQVTGLLEVYIFSKYALIDRTGLNMSIRTRRFNEKQISYDLSANNSTGVGITSKLVDSKTSNNGNTNGNTTNLSSSNTTSKNNNVNSVTGTIIDTQSSFMEVENTLERRTYDESADFISNSSSSSAATVQKRNSVGKNSSSGSGVAQSTITQPKSTYGIDAMNSWTTGGNGVTLFQSANDTAILGFNRGKVWSFTISLVSLGSSMNSLEVQDKDTKKVYQLAYQIVPLPYIFQETHGLIVTPWYRIVNCMDEYIECRQLEDSLHLTQTIPAMMSEGWHRSHTCKDTRLQFKTPYSEWSIGSVDINEIGTNVILIPVDNSSSSGSSSNSSMTNNAADAILIHVEVKFSEPGDLAYMTILVWKETNENKDKWTLSVKNDSMLPITLRQDMKGFDWKTIDRLNHTMGFDSKGNEAKSTDKKVTTQDTKGSEKAIENQYKHKYELSIESNQWLPFGWADPTLNSKVLVTIGTTMIGMDENQFCSIDMLRLGEPVILSLQNISIEYPDEAIVLVMQAVGSGKVLHISNYVPSKTTLSYPTLSNPTVTTSTVTSTDPMQSEIVAYKKELKLYFRSMGISLIAERPIRREFLSLYIEDMEADIILKDATPMEPATNLFEFKIHDIQIDNYSESAVYPILLHSYDSATRKKASKRARYDKNKRQISPLGTPKSSSTLHSSDSVSESIPETLHFFQFTCIQEKPLGLETSIFKYVALRVLEIKVAIDSSTIQLYLLDIHNDLIGETINQDQFKDLSPAAVDQWIDSYNEYMTTQVANPVDPISAKKLGQAYKVYLETLVIHPFKITASFMTTPFPRDQKYDIFASKKFRWLQMIRGIAGVEELAIKITSFIVKNVMESQEALISRISYKITKELQKQLLAIAGNVIGSLNVLGRPAGLYKNIGSGVEDFFYEPYQGAMHSPQDFLAGVGRGAGSLISGVGRGVITSAAAVVGSASSTVAKGATFLTGDEKFAKDREDRRREQSASGGGVIAGIRAGGESVITGFTSGFTGLITKPIEEGRKTGAKGFIKGVGLGVVGVAVKPIMGITDGIASVTQGLTNAVSDNIYVTQARPPRAFDRSPSDERDLILVNLNISAALAQQSVNQWAKKENYSDTYLAYISLGFQDTVAKNQSNQDVSAVILSERYIFFIKHDGSQLWKCPFGNLSHIEYVFEFNTIRLILYQIGTASSIAINISDQLNVDIHCQSQSYAVKAYTILANYSYRMGNPSLVIPVELLFKSDVDNVGTSNHATQNNNTMKNDNKTKSKRMFSYRFGSINHVSFPSRSMSTNEVIRDATKRFSLQIGNNEFRNAITSMDIDNTSEEDMNNIIEGYMKSIDERCMQLICDWKTNHTGLRSSRCLVTVIINLSSYPVSLTSVEIKEGRHYEIFSIKGIQMNNYSEGYDSTSHSIASNGGVAVLFGYGKLPTVLDLAHVKLRIQSTAFVSQVSSRPIGTTCEATGGYTVGFLEKTLTEWWAKYVLLVV